MQDAIIKALTTRVVGLQSSLDALRETRAVHGRDGLPGRDGDDGTAVFGTGRTVTIKGTSATPSAAGLASKAILVARGVTVMHN